MELNDNGEGNEDASRYTSPKTLAPCGDVCTYNGEVVKSAEQTNSKYPQLHKDIDCTNIMLRMAYRDYEVIDPPPRTPPSDLLDQFTMYGAVPMEEYYINDIGNQHYSHSEEYLEALIKKVKDHESVNLNYKDGKCTQDTMERYSSRIRGQHGTVIGTQTPWLEAIMLANDAALVTTLEYNNLKMNHSRIEVYTPYDYADLYLQNRVSKFDFAVTFSSLEHAGLGRYSDPLNPFGDLEAMAQVWCMLKPGGMYAVGIPGGKDKLAWNAHRIYDKIRLPQLTANWHVDELVQCADIHKFIVLTKPL